MLDVRSAGVKKWMLMSCMKIIGWFASLVWLRKQAKVVAPLVLPEKVNDTKKDGG